MQENQDEYVNRLISLAFKCGFLILHWCRINDMTPSQLTRTMNWIAMPIALILLAVVAYHIYQRHFMQQQIGVNYQFDDLPTLSKAPLTADMNKIIAAHIFGVVPKLPETAPVAVEKAPVAPVPKTRLNIKLTGIIDSDSPENGIAMLEVDRGRTLVVAVGENIAKTGATLHQVLPGEVLVDRNGTIESVKMVRKTLNLTKLDTSLLDALPQPYDAETTGQPNDKQVSPESSTGPETREKPVMLRSGINSDGSGRPRQYMNSQSEASGINSKLPAPRILRN